MHARAVLLVSLLLTAVPAVHAFDVVLNAENEYLDAYLVDGKPFPRKVVFIDPDPPFPDDPHSPPPRVGRHVNGKLCFFPKGFGHDGDFVMADDAYREACLDRHPPQARCSITRRHDRLFLGKDPDGWAVFRRNGKWKKQHIHAEWNLIEPQPQGVIDPQGCAFDAQGRFFGNDVGSGEPLAHDGSLLVFFPGRKNRYDTYCFLDKALAAPGMPVMDALGNIYLAETGALRSTLTVFSPPFPTSAADCANPDHLVTTPPTKTRILLKEMPIVTPAGIIRFPSTGHFWIGSVLIPPVVNEYDASGTFVRNIVPENVPRNPLGMDVGSDGTLYYAELNLDPMTTDTRCGSVAQVRFDASGQPLAPETLGTDLAFPDGVSVFDSSRFKVDFTRLPAAPHFDPSTCGGE